MTYALLYYGVTMTSFEEAVLKLVRSIPRGKVMSYGQIAKIIGFPKAAREVGWAMHTLGNIPDFPWWRVLNNKGTISLKETWTNGPYTQKKLLEAEGVEFITDLQLDMDRYRYQEEDVIHQTSLLNPDDTNDLTKK
jgi:methylated-DNA-protein-cysteine methyltransferase-like protein